MLLFCGIFPVISDCIQNSDSNIDEYSCFENVARMIIAQEYPRVKNSLFKISCVYHFEPSRNVSSAVMVAVVSFAEEHDYNTSLSTGRSCSRQAAGQPEENYGTDDAGCHYPTYSGQSDSCHALSCSGRAAASRQHIGGSKQRSTAGKNIARHV